MSGACLQAEPLALRDYRGISVNRPNIKPKRIISGSLVSDEILMGLLAEDKPPSRLVAVSSLATNSQYSLIGDEVKKRSIPARVGDEVESLLSLKPDLLILASFNRLSLIHTLSRAYPHQVFVQGGFESMADLRRHITTLGVLVHEESMADLMLKQMTEQIEQLKRSYVLPKEGRRVLVILPDGFVMGQKNLLQDAMQILGLENFGSTLHLDGWVKVSEETIVLGKYDWIFSSGDDEKQVLDQMKKIPYLRHTSALKRGRVVVIPTALFSTFSQNIIMTMQFIVKKMEMGSAPNGSSLRE